MVGQKCRRGSIVFGLNPGLSESQDVKWLAYAVIKSALFTSDWQFHSPTDKGVSQGEVCLRERRLLRLRSCVVV